MVAARILGGGRVRVKVKSELQTIPNVGPSIEKDLQLLGIHKVTDLKGRKAMDLYDKLCSLTGERQDPCVLDVFLSAIHYAETGEKRTWWSFTPERKAMK